MTRQNRRKSSGRGAQGVPATEIRRARKEDLDQVADLIVRMKRLNNEFDPLFAVVPDARARADKYAASTLGASDRLLLVASVGAKVVGVLRAEMRERLFYEPHEEGRITDFYILPEFRRSALGNKMLIEASSELKGMGAQIVIAEVPTQNEIANKFYVKRGFRALNGSFGKSPQ